MEMEYFHNAFLNLANMSEALPGWWFTLPKKKSLKSIIETLRMFTELYSAA